MKPQEIPRHPWNDMDDGDDIRGSYDFEFFNGKLKRYGAFAAVLMGFEVDSEEAAERKIDSWWEAYKLYIESIWFFFHQIVSFLYFFCLFQHVPTTGILTTSMLTVGILFTLFSISILSLGNNNVMMGSYAEPQRELPPQLQQQLRIAIYYQ